MKRIFKRFGITSAVLSVFVQTTVRAASNYQNVPNTSVSLRNTLVSQAQSPSFDYENFDFWANQCRVLESEQNYTEALTACERAIALKPKSKSAEIWMARSNALLQLGRYAEAVASYDRVIELAPTDSLALTRRCEALFQLGNYEDAIASCENAIRVNGNWGNATPALAWYNRGLGVMKLGQVEQAISSYERALAITPNYSLVLAERCGALTALGQDEVVLLDVAEFGQYELALGQYEEAIQSCDRAIEVNENWGNASPAIAWKNRALVLEKLGRYEEAIASYERALAINSNDAITWNNQGMMLEKLSQHEKALTSYNRAIQISSNYSLALANRCRTLNQLRKYQEAFDSCEGAIQGDGRWEDRSLAYAWTERSSALVGLGNYQEALASAERAIDLQPNSAEAWNNKSVSLWNLESYNNAEVFARRAVEIDPTYTIGWFNYGRILSKLQQYEKAVQAYDQALSDKVKPVDNATRANIWVNRGVALWQLKEYQQAFDSTNEAIKLDRGSFEGWYNQGVVLVDWGKFDGVTDSREKYSQALEAYNEANRISPNNVYVLTGIGMALAGLGRDGDALAAFEKALNISPNYPLAQQERDRLLENFKIQI